MDGTPLDLAEAQRIQQQSLEPKPVVLLYNFLHRIHSCKIQKLLSVAGTQIQAMLHTSRVFSSGTIDETYNEAKKKNISVQKLDYYRTNLIEKFRIMENRLWLKIKEQQLLQLLLYKTGKRL